MKKKKKGKRIKNSITVDITRNTDYKKENKNENENLGWNRNIRIRLEGRKDR